MTPASAPPIDEVVLITTADVTGGREAELIRLFESVEAFRANRPDVRVRHYLLLQRCADLPGGLAQVGAPADIIGSAVDRQVPLSIARNLMLDGVLAAPLPRTSIVAFPDDDAWYPAGTLEHVVDRFSSDAALDFWFCRYGSQAAFQPGEPERAPSLQNILSYASSNTVILRGTVASAIGGFDERLGLGTPAKSGEDTEFAMRARFASREVRYVPVKMIGHRDYGSALRGKYYPGALVAIARHARRSPEAVLAFARKLAVGAALVARRELKPAEFRAALAMLGSNRPAPAAGRPSDIRAANVAK